MVKPNGPVARRADYSVERVEHWRAAALVSRLHYSKGCGNTSTYAFGLHRAGGIVGAATFLPPTKVAAQSVHREWWRVLALSRFVVDDAEPKNVESLFLARCTKMLAAEPDYDVLLTYADGAEGHVGTIYRACGWRLVGMTEPEERWVDRAGRLVSKKMGGRTLTRREMLAAGFASLGKTSKFKFVKELR